jgi:AcrR family transcriptional regulator
MKDGSRSARREATRERVLDAAREVFAERGVIGGSVEDICDLAGFTRGAFYSNFTDKTNLLQALIERDHNTLLRRLDEHLDGVSAGDGTDDGSILATIVDRILATVPENREMALVQTELEIHAIRQPEEAGQFRGAEERFLVRLAEFITRGMGLLGRELTVDPILVADAAMALVEGSVRRALLSGSRDEPLAMARAIVPGLLLSVSRPAAAN